MNLIAEDGSGVPNADSYNSVAELDAYMLKFGHNWPESAPEAPEPVVTPEEAETPENGPSEALGGALPNAPEDVAPEEGGNEAISADDEGGEAGDGEGGEPDAPAEGPPTTSETPAEDPVLLRKQAAARKAAIYIDAAYGTRFTGAPANPEQGLAWPRKGAVDYFGNELPEDKVPLAIKRAHAEVALLAFNGTALAPQTTGGPLLTRKKIDVLEWEWDVDTYGQMPVFGWVDKLLFSLLGPAAETGAMEIMGVQRA